MSEQRLGAFWPTRGVPSVGSGRAGTRGLRIIQPCDLLTHRVVRRGLSGIYHQSYWKATVSTWLIMDVRGI